MHLSRQERQYPYVKKDDTFIRRLSRELERRVKQIEKKEGGLTLDSKYHLSRFVSSELTDGSESDMYINGLMEKMFELGYDRRREWSWIAEDWRSRERSVGLTSPRPASSVPPLAEEKIRKDDVRRMEDLHRLYFRILWRCADLQAVRSIRSDAGVKVETLERELKNSPEARYVNTFKRYIVYVAGNGFQFQPQGKLGNQQVESNRLLRRTAIIAILVEVFVKKLYYLPRKQDFLRYIDNNGEVDVSEEDVMRYISDTDDFKYLEQCRERFGRLWTSDGEDREEQDEFNEIKKKKQIRVKYYGPVGTSGYAKMTRNIVDSLHHASDLDVWFEPVQFHNFNEATDDEVLLSRLSRNELPSYEYVIIHSTPELWPAICLRERRANPGVRVYGITVWESDALPFKWSTYLRFVDKVSVPSEFSAVAMRASGIQTDVVHHPILGVQDRHRERNNPSRTPIASSLSKCPLASDEVRKRYKCVFYNISEWTNRKGVAELVRAFLEEFGGDSSSSDVLLYIKTYGDVGKDDAEQFIADVRNVLNLDVDDQIGGGIMLDYARVDDAYIDCIHECADCYVSTCKSEGHGVGVCYAALFKKPVIITGYGGQMDYLSKYDPETVQFIGYELEQACFCTTWHKKHFPCRDLPHCQMFDGFVPAQQKWAKPDLADCKRKMRERYVRCASVRCAAVRCAAHHAKNENENENKNQKCTIGSVVCGATHNGATHRGATHRGATQFGRAARATAFVRSLISTQKQDPNKRVREVEEQIRMDESSVASFLPQSAFYRFERYRPLRVIVVASYGYGNVGDDCYGEIFKRYLSLPDHPIEIHMVPDRCVMLKTGKLLSSSQLSDTNLMADFDAVIVGGGGLLYRDKIRDPKNSINIYTRLCRERKKPYYLISVGFQGIEAYHSRQQISSSGKLDDSCRELLNGAQAIWVRSVVDYRIASEILDKPGNIERLAYQPDLVYAIRPVFEERISAVSATRRNIVMVVTSNWINVRRDVLVRDLKTNYDENEDELLFVDWDGSKNPAKNENYPEDVARIFPLAKCLEGKIPELSWVREENPGRTLRLDHLWDILLRTKILYTGRYHGLVLGKAASVPRIETYGYMNYKFEADRVSSHDISSMGDLERRAMLPLQHVRDALLQGFRHACDEWNNDDRNTTIVETNAKTGIDVPMLQNLTNVRLHLISQST